MVDDELQRIVAQFTERYDLGVAQLGELAARCRIRLTRLIQLDCVRTFRDAVFPPRSSESTKCRGLLDSRIRLAWKTPRWLFHRIQYSVSPIVLLLGLFDAVLFSAQSATTIHRPFRGFSFRTRYHGSPHS